MCTVDVGLRQEAYKCRIMQACLDVTLPYVHQRKQFGTPIAHNQLIQAKLADMHVKLSAARAYTYAAAKTVDEGTINTRDCAGAIMFASDRAVECTLDTIQCMGGNGYINEIPAGRLLRDAKVAIGP
jgi:isovaleryl-CoA dehydrogenase